MSDSFFEVALRKQVGRETNGCSTDAPNRRCVLMRPATLLRSWDASTSGAANGDAAATLSGAAPLTRASGARRHPAELLPRGSDHRPPFGFWMHSRDLKVPVV